MSDLLPIIYQRLLDMFGNQGWWPADSRDEMIIGAILTQSISWKNVETALSNLKDHGITTISDIHSVELSELSKLVRPARFYNQKALRLKAFASFLFNNYGGSLDRMFADGLSELRLDMLKVNGFGEETVDSILLYAGNKRIFVVDEYTKRVFSRLGLSKDTWSYERLQDFLMSSLKEHTEIFEDYHAQIVHLAKHICLKNIPKCDVCPLNDLCDYYKIIDWG